MKIFIDNKEFEVDPKKTLLEILKEKGYHIPYFCFHPNMRISASCRVCMVEVEVKGRKFLVTSCSTYPQEEMKVFPYSEKSKEARANILEFLLIHHPIDCPLCEKGGKCDLQDFTYDFGRPFPEFTFEKILPPKQKLNGLLRFYQTRCILCYRCSNFWREEIYSDEWLSFRRGKKSLVGPFEMNLTDNIPFLGYLTHICPVGAILDDKDYRFGPRPWDLDEKESSCFLCSTGCELKFWVKKQRREKVLKSGIKRKPDKIYNVLAKDDFDNPTIFCDRIFYGKDFISNVKRKFEGLEVKEFKEKLNDSFKNSREEENVLLISPRDTNEIFGKIRNFAFFNNIKNICVLPANLHSGSQFIFSNTKLSDFENSFTLIFNSLLDFTHPVIGFELFRIMKEGKRRKRIKSAFFEKVNFKNNFFAVISGWEDRFTKNSDFSLKIDFKKSYEFLLDLLFLFYSESGKLEEIEKFKYFNEFFFEEKIKDREIIFKESEELFRRINNYENFILVFNDFLPLKIQFLLFLLSKLHRKGKVLVLRSSFNTEGFLRIFKGFNFLNYKEVKNKIENGVIKNVLLYRVHPVYDTFDPEFLSLLKDRNVFYVNSFKIEDFEIENSIFVKLPFEYSGTFYDNFGEIKKIGKLFHNPVFDKAYDPYELFDEEREIPDLKEEEIHVDLLDLLLNDLKEKIYYPIQKPNSYDIHLIYSENLKKEFDFKYLNPIHEFYNPYDKSVLNILKGEIIKGIE